MNSGKLPVLMTASVSTRGMKGAAFSDDEREKMYVETLKWYLENLPAEQKIVFAENSGWDLGRIKSKVEGEAEGRVELIAVDPGICDQSRGKGYNEILLMNYAIKRSAFIREAGAFMKVTGRYPIYNLPRFLREAEEFFAKGGVFYGDMKDHKVFDMLCKGHTDKWNGHAAYTVLFATTLDFYNANLADSYAECNDYTNQWIEVVWHRKLIPFRNQQVEKVGGGGERNSDHHCTPPPHLSTSVRLRLPVEPICGGFQGSAAQSILVSSSNESLRTKLARFVGNCIRTFTPWFWW